MSVCTGGQPSDGVAAQDSLIDSHNSLTESHNKTDAVAVAVGEKVHQAVVEVAAVPGYSAGKDVQKVELPVDRGNVAAAATAAVAAANRALLYTASVTADADEGQQRKSAAGRRGGPSRSPVDTLDRMDAVEKADRWLESSISNGSMKVGRSDVTAGSRGDGDVTVGSSCDITAGSVGGGDGTVGSIGDVTGGVTALMAACHQELEHEVRTLLQRRPTLLHLLDRSGKHAIHYCAENQQTVCIEQLVTAAKAAAAKNVTVAATAVAKTATDAAPTTSTAAATILNRRDAADGHTVLHLAVISGNLPMVQYLLAAGADLDLVDNEEHSAVHWAVVCGQATTYTHMLFPNERLQYYILLHVLAHF